MQPNGMAPNLLMPKGPLCPTANQPSLRPASSPALSGFEHVFPPTSCWAERHHPSAPVKHHWAVRHQWGARSGAGHVTCLWMLRWGPVQRYHPHRTTVQTTAPACPIPPQRCLLGNGCGCSSTCWGCGGGWVGGWVGGGVPTAAGTMGVGGEGAWKESQTDRAAARRPLVKRVQAGRG